VSHRSLSRALSLEGEPVPVVQHQHVLVLPRPRLRSCRRPFHPSPAPGPYRLPHAVLDRLQAALQPARNREAGMMLATFLGRFWSAPGRLGLPFPVDRRALSGHRDLALSEGRVRGAIKLLEEVGFLEREEPEPGRRYQPTVEGLHRRPLVYRFAPEYRALLTAANRRPRRAPGKAQDGRRALAAAILPATPSRPSWRPAEPCTNSPKNTSQASATLLMGEVRKGLPEGSFTLPETCGNSGVEAALQRLGEALGVHRDCRARR
jgi:hypothetical protein